MAGQRVVVIGAGVAGMSAAILLARSGHRVTVIERDDLAPGRPEDAPARPRPGIAHYLQPHAFIPRGRLEMRTHLPDVYAELLGAGASEVDLRPKLPGPPGPEDEELQYLAVRRPLIEWALRRALVTEPGIERRAGTQARAVDIVDGRAAGVRTDDGPVAADLVVDAHGRRDGRGGGFLPSSARSSPCGVVYYSRYYRCRPGFELPDGPWFLSPRGDLGALGYASFPGDNGTFAALFAVPPGVRQWRAFTDPGAFEAAVSTVPALRSWVDPDGVEPITDVLPMAGLQNRLLDDPAPVPGLVAIGDSYCHTDPTLAHGLAFGLIHAAALAAAAGEHDEPSDVGADFRARTTREVTERFAFASALDDQRVRRWLGEPVDPAHHAGDYALFSLAAAGVVARFDPTVFRVFNRRIGLLDSTSVLDDDLGLREAIEQRFAALSAAAPAVQPTGEDVLAAIGAVAGRRS